MNDTQRIINGWAMPEWWADKSVDEIIAVGAAISRQQREEMEVAMSAKYWIHRTKEGEPKHD